MSPPPVENQSGIQQETIKSGPPLPRTTCPLPCPESRAATPSPALQHGSWGSFTTPGSRKNSTRRTRSTRSTSSSTQSSASHHSKGQQQGTGRVLQFFLKVFCCWPSPSIHEERHKRAKVHPRFCLQFCRVKIGPHLKKKKKGEIKPTALGCPTRPERILRLLHHPQFLTPEWFFRHAHVHKLSSPEWLFRLPHHPHLLTPKRLFGIPHQHHLSPQAVQGPSPPTGQPSTMTLQVPQEHQLSTPEWLCQHGPRDSEEPTI